MRFEQFWAWLALLSLLGGSAEARASCLAPPGDIDGDAQASVLDVQCETLVALWLQGGQIGDQPPCIATDLGGADADCDGLIVVTDIQLLILLALDIGLPTVLDADANSCVDACELDTDADGTPDFDDCGPQDPAIGKSAIELCNGWDDDCDGTVDEPNDPGVVASCQDTTVCNGTEVCPEPAPWSGIFITELMIRPQAVTDAAGEWVELYNATDAPIDINGWRLQDASGELHVIDSLGALFVLPRRHVLLARNGNPDDNGGFSASYQYAGFNLANTADTVQLRDANGTLVDSVTYNATTGWPVVPGASLALTDYAADNGVVTSWASSTLPFGVGDAGTPRGVNRDVFPSVPCLPGPPPSCNDGEPCTLDFCDATEGCQHNPDAFLGKACTDDNVCTFPDVCGFDGTCSPGFPIPCADGDPCTDDACDPLSGCFFPLNTAPCDDDNACTAGDICDEGTCLDGSPIDCDDGNPCTTDGCHPLSGCFHVDTTTPCDDGNPCTSADLCAGGECIAGIPTACNDGNPCTDDACEPAVGCFAVPNGAVCDDGNACTTNDTCAAGSCIGGPAPSCDDGNPCTNDGCAPLSGCLHTNGTGPCSDGSACTTNDACADGKCVGDFITCNDGEPCTLDFCNSVSGCQHNGAANFGKACDDGDVCTAPDVCDFDGNCSSGFPVPCADGNPCTDDSCDPEAGCVFAPNTAPCDDESLCTQDDTCSAGSCVGTTVICDDGNVCTTDSCKPGAGCTVTPAAGPCSDGNACTSDDFCAAGTCAGGPPVVCDDGELCTDDACDPATGCFATPNNAPCDDGNPCTTADTCEAGSCAGGPPPSCDDANACTADSCVETTGCVHVPQPGPCTDNSACTTGDTCQGTQCIGTFISCADDNPCTFDFCSSVVGCLHNGDINFGKICDDDDACTAPDICGFAGECSSGFPVPCNDGNPCTDDLCDSNVGCVFTPNSDACDDESFCTQGDTCTGGACIGNPTSCDDGNVCTVDSCKPAVGCQHAAIPGPCDDGDACTAGDFCTGGTCSAGAPIPCDDGDLCTDDDCDPATGCFAVPNDALCDDGNPCTTDDTCAEGICEGGPPPTCSDANPCTTDDCNEATGCFHVPTPGPCSDGTACTTGDTCAGGECVGTFIFCVDDNPCTLDFCNSITGCQHDAAANFGKLCDDGDSCTAPDICDFVGGCSSGFPVSCDDGNPCTIDTCDPDEGCQHAEDPACDDCCTQGGAGCDEPSCESCVCDLDAFCCTETWDADCADLAADGCANFCGCSSGPSDCCAESSIPTCPSDTCTNCVCADDSFCCEVQWDEFCAESASTGACASSCPCPRGE